MDCVACPGLDACSIGRLADPLMCSPEEESFQNISGSIPGLAVGDGVGVSLLIGWPASHPFHQTANLDNVSIIISIFITCYIAISV